MLIRKTNNLEGKLRDHFMSKKTKKTNINPLLAVGAIAGAAAVATVAAKKLKNNEEKKS